MNTSERTEKGAGRAKSRKNGRPLIGTLITANTPKLTEKRTEREGEPITRLIKKREMRRIGRIMQRIKTRSLKSGEGEKKVKCAHCLKEIDRPQTIYKHQDEIYCSPACLAEALLEKAWDDVEEIWFDTEENMRVCAMEEKAEW